MEMRMFGRTGIRLSVLGFGCGAVGGLMVRGDPPDQERTIARAIDAGVNYFDTAVQYGNGESEKNLGRILQKRKPANAVVGTKVRLPSASFGRIADAVAKSLDQSLTRLRRDRVDIFHLHNAITQAGGGEALSVQQVLVEVVPAFERLRQRGKPVFSALPPSVKPKRFIKSSMQVPSTAHRSSTTCLIHPRPESCRRIIRHRTTDGCSITRRKPVSASLGSACSPAARYPDRLSVMPLRARRPNRSDRP